MSVVVWRCVVRNILVPLGVWFSFSLLQRCKHGGYFEQVVFGLSSRQFERPGGRF